MLDAMLGSGDRMVKETKDIPLLIELKYSQKRIEN